MCTSDGLCVGAVVWTDTQPVGLTAWADDSQTDQVDGYKAGEKMYFKIWDASSDKIYEAQPAFSYGEAMFATAPYCRLSSLDALSTAITEETSTIIPENYMLHQNYPNPFNPETYIKYQIPEDQFVSIKIYDVKGRHIVTLVSEHKLAGTYAVKWDAFDKPSGLYMCRFQAGNYHKMVKLMLLK